MSITSKQLDEIEFASKHDNLPALIKYYRAEIYAAELNKKDSVEFELTNQRDNETRKVIGKRFMEHFAFHKDVWDARDYRLTHIKTGVMVLTGKKLKVISAMKKFADWPELPAFNAAINEHSLQALTVLSIEIRDQYREIYNEARGV